MSSASSRSQRAAAEATAPSASSSSASARSTSRSLGNPGRASAPFFSTPVPAGLPAAPAPAGRPHLSPAAISTRAKRRRRDAVSRDGVRGDGGAPARPHRMRPLRAVGVGQSSRSFIRLQPRARADDLDEVAVQEIAVGPDRDVRRRAPRRRGAGGNGPDCRQSRRSASVPGSSVSIGKGAVPASARMPRSSRLAPSNVTRPVAA